MSRPTRIAFSVLALLIASSTSWIERAMAEPKPGSGRSMTDSPYKTGAPPVTGGFTDTWQGGKKTSGDVSGVSGLSGLPGSRAKVAPPAGVEKPKKEGDQAPRGEPRS
jgi:hypothetical protein